MTHFNKYNVVQTLQYRQRNCFHSNFGIFHIVISILVNVILDLLFINFSKEKNQQNKFICSAIGSAQWQNRFYHLLFNVSL
jgi:hypothetical protein